MKKPITKRWWFWVVIVLVVLAIIGATTDGEDEPTAENPAGNHEPQNPAPDNTPPQEPSNEPTPAPSEEPAGTPSEEPSVEPAPSESSEPSPGSYLEPSEEPSPEPAPSADPEQAFRNALMQYNYVGSAESDKYHKPTCRWTEEINESNLIHFDTIEEAKAAGYEACGTCRPK